MPRRRAPGLRRARPEAVSEVRFPHVGPGGGRGAVLLAHRARGAGQAGITPAPPGRSRRGRGTRGPGPGARRPVENDWAECAGALLHLPDYSALEIFLSKATEIRGALPWQPAAGMLFGVSGLVKSPTVPISCSSGIIPTSRVLPPRPLPVRGAGADGRGHKVPGLSDPAARVVASTGDPASSPPVTTHC